MPKGPKTKKTPQLRHTPLGNEIEKPQGKLRAPRKVPNRGDSDEQDYVEDDDGIILGEGNLEKGAEKLGKSIFEQANAQRFDEVRQQSKVLPKRNGSKKNDKSKKLDSDEEDFDDEIEDEEDTDINKFVKFEGDYVDIDETEAETNALSGSEERVVSQFLSAGATETRNLANIILEKIREKERMAALGEGLEDEDGSVEGGAGGRASGPLPEKVVEVYTSVGKLLKHYTSGKLPRALKMLPHLGAWEEVLWLTRPDEWSPVATYACTRIFASNLNSKLSQRFFNLVLLEKCRDDIRQNGKLNYHLYMALKKSLYKPAAFYKGILLPLALAGDCSLKEAAIFGSVVAKVSIQAIHSAAALLRLTQMSYSGSTSYFIRTLLNKKYALPRSVVEAVVRHFSSFQGETRSLPVIWHQSLLVFAQRYRTDLEEQQREELRALLKNPNAQHLLITPEIRRELFVVGSGSGGGGGGPIKMSI